MLPHRSWLIALAIASPFAMDEPQALAQTTFSSSPSSPPSSTPDARPSLKAEGLQLGLLRFRVAGTNTPAGRELEPAGEEAGSDATGRFTAVRYRLTGGTDATGATGTLTLRRYTAGLTTGELDYQGPALAEEDAVQLVMTLPDFRRGLAITRYNPYWTGPAFASDYRLWPESNVLTLWKQNVGGGYRLLVPVSGNGLVGEVGKTGDRFGVHVSRYAPGTPGHMPLFAFVTGEDPSMVASRASQAVFAALGYGLPRAQKRFPAAYARLGWCSWNAWEYRVSEATLLESARSLKATGLPFGFFLIDDGWLTTDGRKLRGFDADPAKFPHGLAWLTREVKATTGIPHVGVWHALHGYWDGVDPDSPIAKGHALFAGNDGSVIPDPRRSAGQSFYDDWYHHLQQAGINFVKVDGQGNTARFTRGLLPLMEAAEGAQRNVEVPAAQYFSAPDGSVNLLDCMAMQPENLFNWHVGDLVRTSNDYEPEKPYTTKEHLFQNAYNTLWTNQAGWPDFDMFQSDRPDAEPHAIARAVSGGPVYVSDKPGMENVTLLRRLIYADGTVIRPDGAVRPTEDVLLTDTALEPVPLKLVNYVRRPGFSGSLVAAFNVNKGAATVRGALHAADARFDQVGGMLDRPKVAYNWHAGKVAILDEAHPAVPLALGLNQAALFTVVPVVAPVAPFGLLEKYAGVAAIDQVAVQGGVMTVSLREGGTFGAYAAQRPKAVLVDGQQAPFTYQSRLLRVPGASFGQPAGPHKVQIRFR
jgi:hypothetical protein